MATLDWNGVVELFPSEDGGGLLEDLVGGGSLLRRSLFSDRLHRDISLLLVDGLSVGDGGGVVLVVGSLEEEVGLLSSGSFETLDSEDGEEDEEDPETEDDSDVSSEVGVRVSESLLEL